LIEMGQGLMRDSEPHTVSDTLANDENDPVGRLHTRILMGALYRAQDGSTGRVMGVSGHPTIADEVLVAVDHGKTIQTFTGADFRAQYTLFKVVQ
jgi:hypothetical protein